MDEQSNRNVCLLKHSSSGARPGCFVSDEGLVVVVNALNGVCFILCVCVCVNMPD